MSDNTTPTPEKKPQHNDLRVVRQTHQVPGRSSYDRFVVERFSIFDAAAFQRDWIPEEVYDTQQEAEAHAEKLWCDLNTTITTTVLKDYPCVTPPLHSNDE